MLNSIFKFLFFSYEQKYLYLLMDGWSLALVKEFNWSHFFGLGPGLVKHHNSDVFVFSCKEESIVHSSNDLSLDWNKLTQSLLLVALAQIVVNGHSLEALDFFSLILTVEVLEVDFAVATHTLSSDLAAWLILLDVFSGEDEYGE